MPSCVIKLCRNNTTNNKKDIGITYHMFPADPVMMERWAAKIRLSREESWWKPHKRSVICSRHFNETDFYLTKGGTRRLRKGAVPQNALYLSSKPDNISSSTVIAEPSTSFVEITITPTGNNGNPVCNTGNTPPLEDYSDIDSVYDTPLETSLKNKLKRKTALQLKHARIIKTLREKVARLKKANHKLRRTVKSLKQEQLGIDESVSDEH